MLDILEHAVFSCFQAADAAVLLILRERVLAARANAGAITMNQLITMGENIADEDLPITGDFPPTR